MAVLSFEPDRYDAPCPKCKGNCLATWVDDGYSLRMVRYFCPTCGVDWFTSNHTKATGAHVLSSRRVATDNLT